MTADEGELNQVLERAFALLCELYAPAGVLMFWSARITYLGDRRPCDLVVERDIETLRHLCDSLNALADGAFS